VVSTTQAFSHVTLDSFAPAALRRSPLLRSAASQAFDRAAAAECALLITGETGTGKGYVARWIHANSRRAKAPFVPVNCGAIPDSLIDSHLFGHAKGAFSGASGDHLGLVRAAVGGTLLLDEISELPLTAQVRLLRLLEEREVQPVGFSRPVTVNVRIIASSNVDLQERVRQGKFRQDLYFRLDVVRLHLKPLRERVNEIPALIAEFSGHFAEAYGRDEFEFDAGAMRALDRHRWPGNVRELRTVIERLYVMCDEMCVDADALKRCAGLESSACRNDHVSDGAKRLTNARMSAVQEVIASCRGNMSKAASSLGVHRSTLYRWLEDQSEAA
jgi:DNA-binding NtrC family response regulator